MGSTRKMCPGPDGVMEDERGFLAAMATVDHYKIHDHVLTLYNSKGTRVVIFRVGS